MKDSISYTSLLNIIIIFIVISFFAMMSAVSYMKAYRVNSKIVNALEINEGYNELSKKEIDRIVTSYGYQKAKDNCPNKESGELKNANDGGISNDGYCIYYFDDLKNNKYRYGVVTYMSYDFPIVNFLIRIPVYTKTMTMHYFEGDKKV